MLLFVHPAEGKREEKGGFEQFRFMDFVGEGGDGKLSQKGGIVGDFRGKLLEVLVIWRKDFWNLKLFWWFE
jgi:hypothetical protein